MERFKFRPYAEQKHSLLIFLQAPDAGGKDGVVRQAIGSMNSQGCHGASFKQPSAKELAHDFLGRVEDQPFWRGAVVIFARAGLDESAATRSTNVCARGVEAHD